MTGDGKCSDFVPSAFFAIGSGKEVRITTVTQSVSARPSLREGQSSILRGAFHSTQNSGNFGWYIKWNGQVRFGPTGIFGTSFKGGPL